jgi:hypothetical protein
VDAKLDGKLLLTSASETGMPLLATPEGEPLVVSQAEIGVPKVSKPGTPMDLPFTPLVQVRVRVGEDVRFRYGAERRPTEVKIDAGEPGQGRGAPGYVDLSGELSLHGLQADAELHSSEGQLAFPNGTLTLRRGTMWIRRVPGRPPRVTISGEADGRIGEYSVSLRPVGQIYPFAEVTEGGIMVPLLSLNAVTIPHLDEAYVMALLVGPVVAPTSGRTNDLAALLAVPGTGGDSGAEITGVTLPQFGNPLGIQEMALDVGTSGVVRLRLGEELFRRVRVVYVSALTGPTASESFRVMFEVTPLVSVGWSIDEVEQERWEVQSLLAF